MPLEILGAFSRSLEQLLLCYLLSRYDLVSSMCHMIRMIARNPDLGACQYDILYIRFHMMLLRYILRIVSIFACAIRRYM